MQLLMSFMKVKTMYTYNVMNMAIENSIQISSLVFYSIVLVLLCILGGGGGGNPNPKMSFKRHFFFSLL